MAGWVYIISNKAMPGILKIGYTERTPYIRAYELYNTGCPYPYKVDYSIYVDKPYEVEQKTHELQRSTNVGKEWFSCTEDEAIATINQSIRLCNATRQSQLFPPIPTSKELDKIIEKNPSAKSIIENDKKKFFPTENFLSSISKLDYYTKKERVTEEKNRIEKEYKQKLDNLKKPLSMFLVPAFIFLIAYIITFIFIMSETGLNLVMENNLNSGKVLEVILYIIVLLFINVIFTFLSAYSISLIIFAVLGISIGIIGYIVSLIIGDDRVERFSNYLDKKINIDRVIDIFKTKSVKRYEADREKILNEKNEILSKLDNYEL